MQRRLRGREPRLFSNAYKEYFKDKYDKASPAEKAELIQKINATYYEDLSGQALAELGFNNYERTATGLLTNPASAQGAVLMLQVQNKSMDSLSSGQSKYSRSMIENSVSRTFETNGLASGLRRMIRVNPGDYSISETYDSMLTATQKLAAYYVGTDMDLDEAVIKVTDTFRNAYSALADDNKAVMVPANLDSDKVRAGLNIARQSLREQYGIGRERGVWRNMGGGAVGLMDPDGGGWLVGSNGKPVRFSLNDIEILGSLREAEKLYTDPTTGYFYSWGGTDTQNPEESQRFFQQIMNKSRPAF
jgi:hypothetical protein